jgi:hypothetical protein
MKQPSRYFWLAVALQVVILLGMAGRHGYTLMTGIPIKLQVASVDVYDTRGSQPVRLSYAITTLEEGAVSFGGAPYRQGQPVWVTLVKGDPVWTAVAVSTAKPAPAPDAAAVRANVLWMNSAWNDGPMPKPPSVVVRYGLEQFYLAGSETENLYDRAKDLTVEALVDPFGRAALSKVFLAGRELKFR